MTAFDINARALELRAGGDVRGAADLLRGGVERFTADWPLALNLAFVLDELGDTAAALDAYDLAAARGPAAHEPRTAKGLLLFRLGRNVEAEASLRAALALDPLDPAANFAMYDLLQVKGDGAEALRHQRAALERTQLFSAPAPEEARSVLVLLAPGDYTANIPVDFLVDARTTTMHKLFLLDEERLRAATVPPFDVVLCAVAESPDSALPLALAEQVLRVAGRPALNRPERVLLTNRLRLFDALAGGRARLAPIAQRSREQLVADGSPVAYPVIIRPTGSHAGVGLERLNDDAALRAYLAPSAAAEYFVSAFIDYRSADGLYRKYRIICVDGEPYPCHLAISPRWMVHYYNAAMAENAWMRDEEARFLADIRSAFDDNLMEALRDVARRLELEYVGIDCAIDRDGTLLIFEADPAMVVHVTDSTELYGYKHAYVPRIFRAVEQMIDARSGRPAPSTPGGGRRSV